MEVTGISVHELQLSIVSPSATAFEGTVSYVQIPTEDGLIGVLPGHAPLMGLMGQGLLTLKKAEGIQQFIIEEGFLEIKDNRVVVLANQATDLSKITFEQAQKEYEDAEALQPDTESEEREKLDKINSAKVKMRFTRLTG